VITVADEVAPVAAPPQTDVHGPPPPAAPSGPIADPRITSRLDDAAPSVRFSTGTLRAFVSPFDDPIALEVAEDESRKPAIVAQRA
jgi:hypothetical protein